MRMANDLLYPCMIFNGMLLSDPGSNSILDNP